MKKFSKAFLECINKQSINHLRGGEDHPKFTGIWMVTLDGRIFARSYYLRKRSWYNAFLEKGGEIKCVNAVVKVKGVKPADLMKITPAVNAAYQKKYGVRPTNQKWIDGLCEKEKVEKTMEFIP